MKTILRSALITALLSNTVYAIAPSTASTVEISTPIIPSKETIKPAYLNIKKQKIPPLKTPVILGIIGTLFAYVSIQNIYVSLLNDQELALVMAKGVDVSIKVQSLFSKDKAEFEKNNRESIIIKRVDKFKEDKNSLIIGGTIVTCVFLGLAAYKLYKRHKIKKQNAKRTALKAVYKQTQLEQSEPVSQPLPA